MKIVGYVDVARTVLSFPDGLVPGVVHHLLRGCVYTPGVQGFLGGRHYFGRGVAKGIEADDVLCN